MAGTKGVLFRNFNTPAEDKTRYINSKMTSKTRILRDSIARAPINIGRFLKEAPVF